MKVMWIGHGGLLFVSGRNKVLIDPYLSNSMHKENRLLRRKMPIKRKLFSIKPDVIIITNSHPDRADFKTIKKLENQRTRNYTPTILACESAFKSIKENWKIKKANLTMFEEGLEWTVGNINILGVGAKSDDRSAFGLILTDLEDGKKYYVSSSTLYCSELLDKLPSDIYASFIPISGSFGSMNMTDAKRFASKINACYTVPVQFGMFDKTNAEQFSVEGKIIPRIYTVIDFKGESDPLLDTLDKRYNEITTIKAEKSCEIKPADIEDVENEAQLKPINDDKIDI